MSSPLPEIAEPAASAFHFCPRCGTAACPANAEVNARAFSCDGCGFRFYFNVGCAVGVILRNAAGEVLFVRRARDPARGKLALPGGFADPGETGEEVARREAREEVGLEVGPVTYLCSHPNLYTYRGVTYPLLDTFFVADDAPASTADGNSITIQATEVTGYVWADPTTLAPDEIAFPSQRAAVAHYVAENGRRGDRGAD
jgi:ADP-ribose pyrophosphatase YjhB (NUDIX family)/predicted RNA-binding Zn-ribbon protein involved in translation (DUF1610 family)